MSGDMPRDLFLWSCGCGLLPWAAQNLVACRTEALLALSREAPRIAGVNPYTGLPESSEARGTPSSWGEDPVREDEELPEDRFHQGDMVSRHMIDSREQQRKEKVKGRAVTTRLAGYPRVPSALFGALARLDQRAH